MSRRHLTLAVSVVLLWVACSSEDEAETPPESPADEPVEYVGETVGGAIPEDAPLEPPFEEEAGGDVTTDRRCCQKVFSISDSEPPGATGQIKGTAGPFYPDGVTLVRSNGFWTANVCMPVSNAVGYWYEFTSTNASDGGTESAGTTTVRRTSDAEPSGLDGFGEKENEFPSVTDCASVGASTGTLP